MKKILMLALVVAAVAVLSLVSDTRKDVGDLRPIQTLVVERVNGKYALRGDGGVQGRGDTWAAAMENLEQTAAGEAFFGCTGNVVFAPDALTALPDALEDLRLRPAARLYLGKGDVDPDDATAYLLAHQGSETIQRVTAAALEGRPVQLPVLLGEEGRYLLYHA